MTAAILLLFAWVSTNPRTDPAVVLEGSWASCYADGEWEELEFVRREKGRDVWVLHLGPGDEFALFAGGPSDDHIAHTDVRNLLGPKFRIGDIATARGKRNWSKLGYWFSVVQAGESRGVCESFYVKIVKGTR